MLRRLGVVDRVLMVLMAARVTGLIVANTSLEKRNLYLQQAPAQLLDAINGLEEPLSPKRVPQVASALLELEGTTLPRCDPEEIAAKLREYSELCAPTEFLLLQGGDSRLACNPVSGRNMYGCQPFPEAADYITFASSTATSISEKAYAAVEHCRRRLLSRTIAGDLPRAIEQEFEAVRDELIRFLGLTHGRIDVALSPSGTDSHLQAFQIARMKAGSRPVFSIVAAPNETGSGVALAVTGRHFANYTALDCSVSRGAAIDELGGDDVTLASVQIRDAAARPLSADSFVEAVTPLITQAHHAGRFVLLQVPDVSKTGIATPGPRKLRKLVEAFPDNLLVVVDACQMRVANDVVAEYIDLGALVCVTASKFFTAPPFAGALLIPCAHASGDRAPTRLASGCRAYFAMTDWPTSWTAAASLPVSVNLGVLLRWRAGLHEMLEFERVPPAARIHILASLGGAIAMSIEHAAMLEPVESPSRVQVQEAVRGEWDEVQSIFSFRVRRAASESHDFLTLAELRCLHKKMNEDVTDMLRPDSSPDERRLAQLRCHIGQPVALADAASDDGPAALRISTSARLVSHIWAQGDAATAHVRLVGAIADVSDVLAKLALLLRQMFGQRGTNLHSTRPQEPVSDCKVSAV
ncbi:hypothetical protein [Trinickia mobilis]|uniref:hypothetical protein n=1 Tax=Trinickia mobilis TaxID=2816356 RepID=UPI001A8FA398|nr:hypothetical protein [Trinickia mobilis]